MLGAKKRITYNKFHLLLFTMTLVLLCITNSRNLSAFSMTLAIQRSNEVYKNIKVPYRRMSFRIPHQNISLCCNLFSLIIIDLTLWLTSLLLVCGDIETNPGPDSVDSSGSSSENLSATSFELLHNHLSIIHANVQSLAPKIDTIRSETEPYDVFVFSESWLNPDIDNSTIQIEHFMSPFRTDRKDRPGGGVIIYVRDTLFCKRRPDLEIQGLESTWVEIQIKSKKVLVGGFYRPPNSSPDYFDLIKESVDRAYNTNLADIIITGDFNIDMSQNNNNKMTDLLLEYNLKQLITEPTHFTETSSSLIDLILVRNNNNVLTSGVADPFMADYTRYHCPVIILLKFTRPHMPSFKRLIWNYKLADYDKLRNLVFESNLSEKIEYEENIDQNIKDITDTILAAAKQSIPNKRVTINPHDQPWITCKIKKT